MPKRPNIVLILTDQQRFDSLASNGNAICHTPATDRLAREGLSFQHAFTPTALCSPARASLLTGLYPHNHTMADLTNTRIPSVTDLPEGVPSFGTLLSQAGYRTSYVGKWHCGRSKGPLDWGFDDCEPGEGWHEWWPEGIKLEDESAIRLGYDRSKPMAARVPRPIEEYPEVGRTDKALGLLRAVNETERFVFDCQGFIHIREFLQKSEVDSLLAACLQLERHARDCEDSAPRLMATSDFEFWRDREFGYFATNANTDPENGTLLIDDFWLFPNAFDLLVGHPRTMAYARELINNKSYRTTGS